MLFNGTRNFMIGFTLGFGAGLVARDLLPYIGRSMRPMVRGSTKASLRVMEQVKEGCVRFGEAVEDMFAEVRGDMKHEEEARLKRKMVKKPKVIKMKKLKGAPLAPVHASAANKEVA